MTPLLATARLDQLQADLRDSRITRERWQWLCAMIASYEREHDYGTDEDPDATREMVAECKLVRDILERDHSEAWTE